MRERKKKKKEKKRKKKVERGGGDDGRVTEAGWLVGDRWLPDLIDRIKGGGGESGCWMGGWIGW